MNSEIFEQIPRTMINSPIPIRKNPILIGDEITTATESSTISSRPKENRRYSILETNKWKEMFEYHPQNNQEEHTRLVRPPQSDIQETIHELEDAQWREVLGCDNYRPRVVSAPLPVNPEKISGFVKRKSDPAQLPSSRRVSVIETEKWKTMFACDSNFDSRGLVMSAAPAQAEDESWRQFFGCEPDSSSTPCSSPPKSPPKGFQTTQQNRSPQIHLAPITERDSENSSSNGSADLPKPKLMTYIRSMIHSKTSPKKKKKQTTKAN
jgi:hypothetical protein